jgi:hypothetical protein
MELLVTFLDVHNFEMVLGLFENVRAPDLRHRTFFVRKS